MKDSTESFQAIVGRRRLATREAWPTSRDMFVRFERRNRIRTGLALESREIVVLVDSVEALVPGRYVWMEVAHDEAMFKRTRLLAMMEGASGMGRTGLPARVGT